MVLTGPVIDTSTSTTHKLSTMATTDFASSLPSPLSPPGPATRAALPPLNTDPEQWLKHAAQQRRHASSASLSSLSSCASASASSLLQQQEQEHYPHRRTPSLAGAAMLSPNMASPSSSSPLHSPRMAFAESELVQPGETPVEDEEPNLALRPSVLRASLMAKAKQAKARSASMPYEKTSRLSVQSNQSSFSNHSAQSLQSLYSLHSGFESQRSARSSISSVGGWAPRARSSSVSSQGSTGSVNLDALIASGSDINEECPLELEEGEEGEEGDQVNEAQWASREQRSGLAPVRSHPSRSRNTTAESGDLAQHHLREADEFWQENLTESDMMDHDHYDREDDDEFDETLKSFSQLSLKSTGSEVRGLSFKPAARTGRNPFDLDADYMDSPIGFVNPRSSGTGIRTIAGTTRASALQRPSLSGLKAPSSGLKAPSSGLRPPASGLKAPTSRLAQPGARPGLVPPKATPTSTSSSKISAPRQSGLPPSRTGSSSTLTRASSMARPGVSTAGSTQSRNAPAANARGVAPGRSLQAPSTAARTGSSRSLVPPTAAKKTIPTPAGTSKVTMANRTSLLPPSSASRISTIGLARANSSASLNSPRRTLTTPTQLASPTRTMAGRSSSSHLISPTSSQSSTSSLPSLSRDSITPLSQRLTNATGTATKARPAGKTLSMYGSSTGLSRRQPEDVYEDEYETPALTPPHSPSSARENGQAGVSRIGGMARPSSIVPPSRLAPPTAVSRIGRPASPAGSHLPQPSSRIPSGLVAPRAGLQSRR